MPATVIGEGLTSVVTSLMLFAFASLAGLLGLMVYQQLQVPCTVP